jgi:hypothetical protein
MDSFAPYLKQNGVFIVKNITSDHNKTIKIFNYPINYNTTRDLLQIPGVSESDIRSSLLKGELQHKIRAKDVIIVDSDIDLLQFNSNQLAFLKSAGITNGMQIDLKTNSKYPSIQDAPLLGVQNSINTIFNTPSKFNISYNLIVHVNGIRMLLSSDYLTAESGGPGTGYDTIIFIEPPAINDTLRIDYYGV